jgi:NADP-dependent 3-hydroxy acid dehydrogenase YdfG
MTIGGGRTSVPQSPPQDSWLRAEDVARTVVFMVTQPAHVAINEIMVRPTAQER